MMKARRTKHLVELLLFFVAPENFCAGQRVSRTNVHAHADGRGEIRGEQLDQTVVSKSTSRADTEPDGNPLAQENWQDIKAWAGTIQLER